MQLRVGASSSQLRWPRSWGTSTRSRPSAWYGRFTACHPGWEVTEVSNGNSGQRSRRTLASSAANNALPHIARDARRPTRTKRAVTPLWQAAGGQELGKDVEG